jgi:hypothetical protein
MSHRTAPVSGTPFAGFRSTPLWLALLTIGVFVLAGSRQQSEAEPKGTVEIAYISVIGEGPIARAWYDGAPSPGVPVQDALDHFAEKGYVVARTTDALRQSTRPEDNSSFAIILQRVR